MSKTNSKPQRPTKEKLEQWSDLDMERSAAGRAARAAAAEQKIIEQDLEAYYRANKPKNGKAMTLHGYTLKIVAKAKSVSWKNAFLRLLGADAAKKEELDAGTVEKLVVLSPTDD